MSRNPSLVAAIRRTLATEDAECSILWRENAGRPRGTPTIPCDVAVLDHGSVSDAIRQMRRLRCQVPTCGVLVVNVRSHDECVRLLDEGADDACTSDWRILAARLRALTRRARALNADLRVAYGGLIVDREHRRVWSGTIEMLLSPREYDLLLCLFNLAPSPVSKRALAAGLWKEDAPPQRNTVEVYVSYLRRKLELSHSVRIETVRRVGYALIIPVAAVR